MARDRRAMADALEKRAKDDADRELVAKLREDAAALEGRAGRSRILDSGQRKAETRTHRISKRRTCAYTERKRQRAKARWQRVKAERAAKQEAG
jgi:hypothetical protein